MNKLEILYRQLIMDHYKNPRNKGLSEEEGYKNIYLKNPSCGDEITIQTNIADGIVKDVRHEGTGCSICCSSASVMSTLLVEKKIQEVEELISLYYSMLKGDEPSEKLEDAVAYQGVSKFPARFKCATIAWNAIEEALKDEE